MNLQKRLWLPVACSALLLPNLNPPAHGSPEEPEVGTAQGQQHPDFLLPSLDGGFLRLSDYRGKRIFLFHFASW